ncbi:hypothetical protein [Tautonia rosea]|uniref:hypothetical protein n=1 Tax=Tautonia rosea TaxID=2728037 RepID=UPI0014736735|nr:hypothetical protein [Tautonia rosea]
MANPTVEKLKTLALRFADKVAVAVTAVLCLVFVFLAVSKETIDTTPDRVSEIANQAQQNINRQQDEKAIVSKIEDDGMVLQDFGTQVAKRETTKVDVRQFSLARAFVKAEPGAGLIRDSVNNELLAPYELIATSGRGGMPFAVRDASGNLVPPDPDEKKSSMSGMAAMYGMGQGMMPGMGGTGATTKKNVREEQLAARQESVSTKKSQAAIAGAAGLPLPEEDDSTETTAPVDFKTEVRGQRWVAVVGLLNNKQFRERYATALKVPVESPESHPDYKRIELSRQSYDPVVGDWSSWTTVDPDTLNQIVEDVAFEEDPSVELTPDPVRLDPIVAFLPYLSAGYWAGVHHAQLIPPDKLRELLAEKEEKEETPMGMMGMMGMMEGGRGGMSDPGMMESMMGQGMMGSMMGGRSEMGMMGEYGMMGMGMGMGMGRPAGAGPEHMTEEDIVMVRAIDYTVDPGTTYRYRVRVVVSNPNYNREDVAPGVDTEAREFAGPWSDPTEIVRVPADVSIFALNPARGGAYSADTVVFDVAAWDSNTGSLVVSNFPTAPGEFVGRPAQRQVAVEGEDEPQNKVINLQSRQLVIDTIGGPTPVQNLGLPSTFELPAVVAVLRPDGTIALHNQSTDATDEQLLFMRESYRLSISNELNKKNRGNDIGMMYGGMMGSF